LAVNENLKVTAVQDSPNFLQLHLGRGFENKMILIIFYICDNAFEKELELAVSVWDCVDSVSNSS
jgi:hypothetical protein